MTATAAPTGSMRKLSVDQMLRLMQLEVDKAQKHRYPLSCMLFGLDGFESAEEEPLRMSVMPSVFHALKRVTFERGVQGMGFWTEKVILAIFPHVGPQMIAEVGEALVERARLIKIKERAELAVTVCGGVAHNQHSGPMSFEVLIREAETGYSMARQSGGNRCVQWLEVETELDRLRDELEETIREVERRSEEFSKEQDELAQRISREFVSDIQSTFAAEAPTEATVRLERAMISLALGKIDTWRESSLARELAESRKQVDNLERRVRKLTDLLSVTESELKRVAAMKMVDTGIASIYRTVQGIADADAYAEVKRELMKSIFEANLALQGRQASEESKA